MSEEQCTRCGQAADPHRFGYCQGCANELDALLRAGNADTARAQEAYRRAMAALAEADEQT